MLADQRGANAVDGKGLFIGRLRLHAIGFFRADRIVLQQAGCDEYQVQRGATFQLCSRRRDGIFVGQIKGKGRAANIILSRRAGTKMQRHIAGLCRKLLGDGISNSSACAKNTAILKNWGIDCHRRSLGQPVFSDKSGKTLCSGCCPVALAVTYAKY